MEYEFIYLISTYERYEKLKSLVDEILNFKNNLLIIVIDDCSKDERYFELKTYNEKLIFLKNEQNNGKERFWVTISSLFKKLSEFKFRYGVMLQDDFVLIPDFEKKLSLSINDKDIIRLFTQTNIGKTNWGYENWIDGAYCAPYNFFKALNFEILPIKNISKYGSSGVGSQITQRLNRLNYRVLNYGSMVEHSGNFDSKMHSEYRKTQPLFANFKSNNSKLSVIIPTYNNLNFLPQCLNSVLGSIKNIDCEVLIGIDNCFETLEYVKHNSFDSRFRFYFFEENLGPYVIKNTLSLISSSEILLFFDSDDVIDESCVSEVLNQMNKVDLVKMKYLDFENELENLNYKQGMKFGEGVFAIKKSIFINMNGFYPWRCAADSDFMARIYNLTKNISFPNVTMFYRRKHPNSLTQREDTGLASKLRASYIKSVNGKIGPEKLTTANLTEIYFDIIMTDEMIQYENHRNKALDLINNVIKLNPSNTNQGVDYNKINEITQKKGGYILQSSAKPIRENKPDDRNKLTEIKKGSIVDMNKKMMGKPKRKKSDSPNISSQKRKRF